jgi:hypothetical protein
MLDASRLQSQAGNVLTASGAIRSSRNSAKPLLNQLMACSPAGADGRNTRN